MGREPEDIRPDITHQCLLMLQDSALNQSGQLAVFIRTMDHQLIEVSPQLTVPKSGPQFDAMMVTFLQRKSIKAQETNVVLMRFVKNDLDALLPAGCRRFGLSVNGDVVKLADFCKEFASAEGAIAFFIGAVAKSDPTSKKALPMLERAVCVSQHHLTAAMCCGKICHEFEDTWKVL